MTANTTRQAEIGAGKLILLLCGCVFTERFRAQTSLACCKRNITKAIAAVIFGLISVDSFPRVKKELR